MNEFDLCTETISFVCASNTCEVVLCARVCLYVFVCGIIEYSKRIQLMYLYRYFES